MTAPRVNVKTALVELRRLGTPVVRTSDAAALLGISVPAAAMMLRRLAQSGLAAPLRKGLWSLRERVDPLVLADYLTAPYPSYVSLQSALYLHGMIEQIPATTFVVTAGRSQRIRTAVGRFSVHRIAPELFGGFEIDEAGVKLATPEKALVDVFYLSATRRRLFAALPEVELPRRFRVQAARSWIERIPSQRLRTIAQARLDEVLARADSQA